RELKILSLACSSGEETYTLNIMAQETGLFLWDWDVRVIGIDIDKGAIKKARLGRYGKNSFRLNGNPECGGRACVDKYFTVDGDFYILRKSIRKNVEFRFGNLLSSDSFNNISGVDVIFCRNVLIYMDDNSIGRIAENIYRCLSESGYLFIGSAESLIQKTDLFYPEYTNGIIVYRKNA
ncbi:MAG: protein-glutamate O-methyltransferase CheR, partial [Nitrospirae bacterium]|nr:protein-glutamate O-methyltransferase CheR [Nitrospirota bacterium]